MFGIEINTDKSLFEFIGFNGPIITSFLVIIYLIKRLWYLIGYIIFYYINKKINEIIKLIVKQERPKNGVSFSEERYEGAHKYGFPSGHSQDVFFNIVFLYLATKSLFLLIITCFIALLTIFQRWKTNRHTIIQLVVGALLGSVNGYMSYKIIKYLIEKNIITKLV